MRITKMRTAALLGAALWLGACGGEAAEEGGEAAGMGDTAAAMEAGEGGMPESPHGAMGGAVTRVGFTCAEGTEFRMAFMEGQAVAELELEGETYDLESQATDSGMMYSDGDITFRGEGREAWLERGGERIAEDCRATGHGGAPPSGD